MSIAELDMQTIVATMRAARPGETIRPRPPRPETVFDRLQGERFVIRGVLGEGGMGTVHSAEHRALGREVAVKMLRADVADPDAAAAMLHEALITGAVQHPNVVPIYDIDLDAEGNPRIILKSIEGDVWADLMHADEVVASRFGAHDLREWNLRVVGEVLRALHFAHSKGIVHRDVKPDNVMVGEFGEIYLLDWGVAVAFDEEKMPGLPLGSDSTQIAGTAFYMAPEQLWGARAVTHQTDVFLVGAMLYEMLTGSPPHQSDVMSNVIRSISSPPTSIEGDVDPELARIVLRAMAANPVDRYASAEDLRRALEAHTAHRSSRRLMELAEKSHAQMVAAFEDDQVEADTLFMETWFGYRAALDIWSENAEAREGTESATLAMVQHHLSRDDPQAAERVLRRLDDPPSSLVERVRQACIQDSEKRAEVDRIVRESDRGVGHAARKWLLIALGIAWSLGPIVGHYSGVDARHTPGRLIGIAALFMALLGVTVWKREEMLATRLNRAISSVLALMLGGQVVWIAGAVMLGLGVPVIRTGFLFLYALGAAVGTLVIDRRLFPALLVYIGAFLIAAYLQSHIGVIIGLANGFFITYLVVANPRPSNDSMVY